jgi:hypothetical protein
MDIFHFYGIFPICVLLKFEESFMHAGISQLVKVNYKWGVGKRMLRELKISPAV